ncbi:transcriptional regulator [Halobacteriovorax marinus]|uniref:Transcriptional regulator n=1 Tax=Halobacteriovorax marinus (strain ATCC BAA-682 / DSM 15412 / SJ) TaxID=862908 RepID=E1X0I6_HALMS|nr:helix-turn-helix domain-containing protein [Halobacteriovorax marinus]ATH09274.1 transcriptional regulator [Halobacteriovorax marinus]CBW28012.1 putative transcriptional regulator [Halobacteriovorax marinus SJ]
MSLTKDQLDISTRNIYTALDIIGGKWKIKILGQIYFHKEMRFNNLLRSIPGISNKVLSQQLKELERDEIIKKQDRDNLIHYVLDTKGSSINPILTALCNWAGDNYY